MDQPVRKEMMFSMFVDLDYSDNSYNSGTSTSVFEVEEGDDPSSLLVSDLSDDGDDGEVVSVSLLSIPSECSMDQNGIPSDEDSRDSLEFVNPLMDLDEVPPSKDRGNGSRGKTARDDGSVRPKLRKQPSFLLPTQSSKSKVSKKHPEKKEFAFPPKEVHHEQHQQNNHHKDKVEHHIKLKRKPPVPKFTHHRHTIHRKKSGQRKRPESAAPHPSKLENLEDVNQEVEIRPSTARTPRHPFKLKSKLSQIHLEKTDHDVQNLNHGLVHTTKYQSKKAMKRQASSKNLKLPQTRFETENEKKKRRLAKILHQKEKKKDYNIHEIFSKSCQHQITTPRKQITTPRKQLTPKGTRELNYDAANHSFFP